MVRTADLNNFRQNKAWEFKTAFCDYNGALEPLYSLTATRHHLITLKKTNLFM